MCEGKFKEMDVQMMVGGNVILTFGRVDVELTRKQAVELKVCLENALEWVEPELLLFEVSKST
jgi:hypothetical protein